MTRFECPKCGASHDRGFFNGVDVYRCLLCGYVGHGFHPDEQIDSEIGAVIREEQAWQRARGLPEGPFAPDEESWRAAPPAPRP